MNAIKTACGLLILSAMLHTGSSCTADQTPLVVQDSCNIPNLSYQTIRPLLVRKCSDGGCHDASFSPNVLVYADLKVGAIDNGLFQRRVLELKDMPAAGLSSAEMDSVRCWAAAGYPEN